MVTATALIARKGDAESYEPAFTEPRAEGVEFVVVEQRGDWIRVRLDGRLDGWVPRDKVVLY